MDDVTRLSRCERCGAPLALGVDAELCERCRASDEAPTYSPASAGPASESLAADAPTIAVGSRSTSEHETFLSGLSGARSRPSQGPRPAVGQTFGPYRVERPLGSGGMGDVYEAEHLEHGRRVALKVLGQQLASAEDRLRFLREGELAASITHTNTVYIYGSEEIGGAPVIAMELLSGGTLRDLVRERGPLPPQQAVDLVLQVIDGLEAAHHAGILHRDIKPANCFIDREGGVKVGDFGLSIATVSREAGATGFFQGTPQFAPPEQLRGEALDVRADIYAVGATLFYLLTGEPPFNDPDLTTLVSRVKEETPRSAREMRAGVPVALAAVVTSCLAKDRAERPATYADLRERLQPFSAAAAQPAPLGRRFLAGIIDQLTLLLLQIPISTLLVFVNRSVTTGRWWVVLAQIVTSIAYYGVSEGRWGAAVGKRILRLAVADANGRPPGIPRATARALFGQLGTVLGLIPMAVVGSAEFTSWTLGRPGLAAGLSVGAAVLHVLILFSTARRRNGFAAIQDLATGTRVVRVQRRVPRPVVEQPLTARAAAGSQLRRLGPFDIVGSLGPSGDRDFWIAVDPVLKRRVWIVEHAPGAAAITPLLRDLSRHTRLRWLGGRRTTTEAWDAFEAFDGAPLVSLDRPQPWIIVKRWLLDLATELDAGLADGSLPALTLDRVWITSAGRAKLLDFCAPGLERSDEADVPPSLESGQAWLSRIAVRGLGGRPDSTTDAALPGALPLTARTLIDRLSARTYPSAPQMAAALSDAAARPDAITPWRRVASVALCGTLPALFTLLGFVAAFAMRESPSGAEALIRDLVKVSALPPESPQRQAMETYIGAEYPATIQSELTWALVIDNTRARDLEPLALQILASHRQVSADELARAKAALGPFLAEEAKVRESADRRARIAPYVVPSFLFALAIGTAAAAGVLLATLMRGGLMLRAFGMAVVTRSGRQASRLRSVARAIVAWGPALLFASAMWGAGLHYSAGLTIGHPLLFWSGLASLVVFLAGAVVASLRASRGVQDVVAATWLVPR